MTAMSVPKVEMLTATAQRSPLPVPKALQNRQESKHAPPKPAVTASSAPTVSSEPVTTVPPTSTTTNAAPPVSAFSAAKPPQAPSSSAYTGLKHIAEVPEPKV